MRNLDTPVKQIRHKIFTEVAKIGFESTDETLIHDIEAIPYNIVEERAQYRESIYREMCRGCVAHPCMQACPKGAISHNTRPCEQACGVKAIGSDEQGRAKILDDKCVSCGMCMVSCPFGAISDKSQIFQLAHSLRDGNKIIAIVAPAYISQFGDEVTPDIQLD